MLYDEYEARMKKIAEVLNRIRKHRVIISVCAAILIAFVSVLLFINGMMIEDAVEPSAPVLYGDELQLGGKAIFGEIQYRFKREGEQDWLAGLPQIPGNYRVQAVTKRSFGVIQYGKELALSVVARPIVFSFEPTTVYGDAPILYANNLAKDDRIIAFEHRYATPFEVGSDFKIDPGTIRIENATGDDVTGAYSFDPVEGSVSFSKRAITVRTADGGKEYDGEPLSVNSSTVTKGSLAYSDHVYFTVPFHATLVTENGYENRLGGLKILDGNGNDVSARYDVTLDYGHLSITPRPIEVTSGSVEKIYDGGLVQTDSFEVTNGYVLDTHTVVAFMTGTTEVNVGSYKNEFTVQVTDAAGNDVSYNYKIEKRLGTLNINPRPLKLKASDRTWIFDGFEHSGETLLPKFTTSNGLSSGPVPGHTVSATATGRILRAGTAVNSLTNVKILDASKNDVSGNYDISVENGTLTVEKRPITVKVADVVGEYDGSLFTPLDSIFKPFEIFYGYKDGTTPSLPQGMPSDSASLDPYADKLLGGNGNLLLNCDFEGGRREPGVGSARAIAVVVTDIKTGDIYTDCYLIDTVDGIITVVPKKLIVTPELISVIYDGKQHFASEGNNSVNVSYSGDEFGLAFEHKVSVVLSGSGTEVGSYVTTIQSCAITDFSGKDITSNYEIELNTGVLEIRKRPFVIITSDRSWEYDGKRHGVHEMKEPFYSLKEGDSLGGEILLPGHTLAVITSGELTEAGTVPHSIDSVVITDENGNDVTSFCYDISFESGALTVTPRRINIYVGSAQKYYDGTPLTESGYEITFGALVEGHRLTVTAIGSQTVVGSSPNKGTGKVFDENDKDVSSNYTLAFYDGTLTVAKRPVTLGAMVEDFVYDGVSHLGHELCAIVDFSEDGGLLDGHYAIATFDFTRGGSSTRGNIVRNAGEYSVTLGDIRIFDENGEDCTACYYIARKIGKFNVTPRPITISAISRVWPYDGEIHYGYELDPACQFDHTLDKTLGALGPEDYAMVVTDGAVSMPGESAPHKVVGVNILGASGEDVTYCYDITTLDGTLMISGAKLVLRSESAQKLYDGTPLVNHKLTITGKLLPGHTLERSFSGTQTEVGVSQNTFEYRILDSEGNDVKSQYDIEVNYGKLRVYADPSEAEDDNEHETDIPSGGISGGITGEVINTPVKPEGKPLFEFTPTDGGVVYFRYKNFGDYSMTNSWYLAPDDEGDQQLTLVAEALRETRVRRTVEIRMIENVGYQMPYYADRNTVDATINGEYSIGYYAYDYLNEKALPAHTDENAEYEAEYRKYVYDNYTALLLGIDYEIYQDPYAITKKDIERFLRENPEYNR